MAVLNASYAASSAFAKSIEWEIVETLYFSSISRTLVTKIHVADETAAYLSRWQFG